MTDREQIHKRLDASVRGISLSRDATERQLRAMQAALEANQEWATPVQPSGNRRLQSRLAYAALFILVIGIGLVAIARSNPSGDQTLTESGPGPVGAVTPVEAAPPESTPAGEFQDEGAPPSTLSVPATTLPAGAADSRPATSSPPNDVTTSTVDSPDIAQATAPPTSVAVTSAPQTSDPPVVSQFALTNGAVGDTSSSDALPLVAGPSPNEPLANFDDDRDDGPGLLIQNDEAGLSTNDAAKHQDWRWTAQQQTNLSGVATLTIWVAAKDFETDEEIGLIARLEVCSPACSSIGIASWSEPSRPRFQQATLSFGSIDEVLSPGAVLQLRLAVPDSLATTDVWVAYGAADFPSTLTVN